MKMQDIVLYIKTQQKEEKKIWKMMIRVVAAAGLCLFIGLQSLGSVQAAVNYEVCPYCYTRMDRYEEKKIVFSTFAGLCSKHSNCDLYNNVYDTYDVIRCQTPGCPINKATGRGDFEIVEGEHTPK